MSDQYNEYRWKWENYPKLHAIGRVPINLDIEVTTRCNYKCIMCEQSFNPPEPLDMPISLIRKIIDEFAEKGGSAIKFCYLGEPLLYPFLFEAIQYAKESGIIDTIVATNGSLLDKKKIKELIESGLDLLIFSIDSIYHNIYAKIRVGGNLAKVRTGIIDLCVLKQVYQSDTPQVQIQAIPMHENREEIISGQYEQFWKPFADVIRISPFCEDYKINIIIGETPEFFCPGMFQRMTVRADGKIALCCGKRSDDKILGNIYEHTLEEIWLGKEFAKIRQLMIEGKSHLIKQCQTCSLRQHGGKMNHESII